MANEAVTADTANLNLLGRIRARVEVFFNLRDTSYVSELFNKHANPATNLMAADSIRNALRDIGIQLTAGEAAVLLETFKMDKSGGLDLQGFMKAIKHPSKVEQWVETLQLSKLLAQCLSFKESDDPLREVSRLSSDEVHISVTAYTESLQTTLTDALGELKKYYAAMDKLAKQSAKDASSKLKTFKMRSGGVDAFHIGLQGRVGAPHPNLPKGMEEEHCIKAGCNDEFISSNYGVRTTPSKEYEIATGRRELPPEDMLDKKGRKVRTVRRIEELKRLKLAQKAGLTEEEIIAVVLYTGPMFQVYNAILRQHPADVFSKFLAGGNLYATTIHILVSAVIKIARATKLPSGLELFRGLDGLMELPDSFLRVDANGCRGYAEWGFLSATSDKAVAVEVSLPARARALRL